MMCQSNNNRYDQFYANLEDIQSFIIERRTDELQAKYFNYCVELSGLKETQRIAHADLSEYQRQLEPVLKEIIDTHITQRILTSKPVRAVYFEYDWDNSCEANFYLCNDYYGLSERNDDWACDWDTVLDAPAITEIDKLNVHHQFLKSNKSLGIMSFTVARISIAFAEVCFKFSFSIPVGIGFHDQSYITRVFPDSAQ